MGEMEALRIEYRAPDDSDVAAMLGGMLKGGGSLAGNLAFSLVISGMFAALVFALSKSWMVAVAMGCALFLSSLVSNLSFFKAVERRRGMRGDASAVEVIHVDASRIVEVQPVGTGAALVFFTSPGEALLINGQWQLEFRPFPVAKFKLHRWADTKQPIRIESLGELVFPEESGVEVRPDYVVGDVELFKADPDTLQQDMDAAFGRPRAQ